MSEISGSTGDAASRIVRGASRKKPGRPENDCRTLTRGVDVDRRSHAQEWDRHRPEPLETVVGVLCGCASVTFERAAHEARLNYSAIDFEAGYILDRRGLFGESPIRPYYQSVSVQARAMTSATRDELAAVEVTERRCPVRNILVDAGVTLTMTWTIAEVADAE